MCEAVELAAAPPDETGYSDLRTRTIEAARTVVLAGGDAALSRQALAKAAGVEPRQVSALFRSARELLELLRESGLGEARRA